MKPGEYKNMSVRTNLLISLRNLDELSKEIINEVDILDLKDPLNGSIGAWDLQDIKKGLVGVVNDREGTGFQARVDDKVAGKTGTAQVISKDSKKYGYGKFKNHGWFTAYYPSDKPEIAITVFAEHGDSGGSAGGPIIKQIISYYKKNYLENNDQL